MSCSSSAEPLRRPRRAVLSGRQRSGHRPILLKLPGDLQFRSLFRGAFRGAGQRERAVDKFALERDLFALSDVLEDVKKSRQRKGREDRKGRIFRKDALRALRSLRST